jgi:alkylation response protein AidB-like acyl-CoA dehydrogenase
MDRDEEILQSAKKFLREEVAPNAWEIDFSREALKKALDGLASRNMMALRRPEEYGGPGISEASFRDFQESVARYSGALAFLQTQHQSAVSMISKSDNQALKDEYLPKMSDGTKYVGIGFSQLRRAGPPVMTANAVDGGYVLDGHVPYITGWSIYQEFLVGATLPDGQAVFGVVPFVNTEAGGGKIHVNEPMKLAAMDSAMTVTADFTNWLLPTTHVAFVRPAGWIQNNDLINITLQGHFALGCARGGLDIVQQAAEKKGLAFIENAYSSLSGELQACHEATTAAQATADEESTTERLKIRAWAIDLAVRCAHAAIIVSSGAANSLKHPAQRVYREALVYTVSAQTTAIMDATLQRITARGY